jgi:hypothetical protein
MLVKMRIKIYTLMVNNLTNQNDTNHSYGKT